MTLSHSGLVPLLVALTLAASALPARADASVTVGDPANPTGLSQALHEAHDAGARRIVVRKGLYTIPPEARSIVHLSGWEDTEIDGYGVTIIANGQNELFSMRRCKNVTIAGFTLSQAEMTHYQGKVRKVDLGDGRPESWSCEWMPDAGYPAMAIPTPDYGCIDVIDGKTRTLKVGTGDFAGMKWEALPDGADRLSGFRGGVPNIAVGDWLVARYDHKITRKVHLDGCENCTIRDISMMRNGFAPIFETGGAGGNRLLGCKWLLGPKPAGATEEPLVTAMADGFHSAGMVKGPDIENCVMEGVLLDDCFAIHGAFEDVVSAAGNTLTIAKKWGQLAVGQPIRICDKAGFFAEGTVTALKDNGDKTLTVTLDREISATLNGAKVYNPLACGAGYKIIGCKLGHTRSRGILVKSDDGLIRGNTIEGCQMSAVSIGPEFWWGEAGYVKHVVVENNTILRCGGATYGGAAVWVHGDGAIGNSDIVIRNNTLSSDYQGDFVIEWASDVKLYGNEIVGCSPWPTGFKPQSMAWIDNCRGVAFERNTVRKPRVYKVPLVAVGDHVADLTGSDASGVRPIGR